MANIRATPSKAQMAVFTRNHARHLEAAADLCARDPNRLVTFRSHMRWATVADAVEKVGPIPVYFAVVDAGPEVRFAGIIEQIQLDPDLADPKTQRLLAFRADTTKDEGLRPDVATLYAVAECRGVAAPFPFTELLKYHDGTPIDEDYQRAYVLVRTRLDHAR